MSQTKPEQARIENGKPLRIAGLRCHYRAATMREIPAQWTRFAPMLGTIAGQVGRITYGLCFTSIPGEGIEYLSGVEVAQSAVPAPELSVVEVPARKYAVYLHRGHVSKLHETIGAIESQWFPASGYKAVESAAGVPDFFERYGEEFDPATGMGGIEVWIPIRD